MELIRLTAFADEVPRLQTMAIQFAVEYAGKDAAKLAKTADLEKLDSWELVDHYVNQHGFILSRIRLLGCRVASGCKQQQQKNATADGRKRDGKRRK